MTDQALLAPPFHKSSAATVQMVGLRSTTGVVFIMFTPTRKTVEKTALEKEDLFESCVNRGTITLANETPNNPPVELMRIFKHTEKPINSSNNKY